jgi:excisionase family DNA binding protein
LVKALRVLACRLTRGPFSCPCALKCSTLYSSLQPTASYQKGVVGTATEELLSPQEAADRLGVSVYTVRRWIKDGKLRAFKPGKEYRVREADLEEFLAAREVRPKAIAPSPQRSLFNGLEEERRYKLEEARRAAHYIIGRAERYEQEIEGGRVLGPKTAARAADRAYILAALAIEEFSSFHRWFFDEVARDLVREIENGNAPELVDEFDSLEETFIERISRTQRMLLDNASNLAETEDQGNALAKLRKTGDSNVKIRSDSA